MYGVFSWVSGDITSASNAATYVEDKPALRRPLSAPDRALGCPELRAASASWVLADHVGLVFHTGGYVCLLALVRKEQDVRQAVKRAEFSWFWLWLRLGLGTGLGLNVLRLPCLPRLGHAENSAAASLNDISPD